MRHQEISDTHPRGADKSAMYGWSTVGAPGKFMMLPKGKLQVHPGYQRERQHIEIKEITADWFWPACGALIVCERGGDYWIVDGQQRHSAALRKSDIDELPCMVHFTTSPKEEAEIFLRVNKHRRSVSAIASHRAGVFAERETETFVAGLFETLSLRVADHPKEVGDIKCIGSVTKKAARDRDRLERSLGLAARVAAESDTFVSNRILGAFWSLDTRLEGGVMQKRFSERVVALGAGVLEAEIQRQTLILNCGGNATWMSGVMSAVNKGLRTKIEMLSEGSDPGGTHD